MRHPSRHGDRAPVNCPLHDAFLVESPAEDEADVIDAMRSCMAWASRLVLEGVEVPVKARVVRWPDRYVDDRTEAKDMWRDAMGHLVAVEREARRAPADDDLMSGR